MSGRTFKHRRTLSRALAAACMAFVAILLAAYLYVARECGGFGGEATAAPLYVVLFFWYWVLTGIVIAFLLGMLIRIRLRAIAGFFASLVLCVGLLALMFVSPGVCTPL